MLNDFFKLNEPFKEFDENKLVEHFEHSKDLRGVWYKPDEWPNQLRRSKSLVFENVSLSKTKFNKKTFTECRFDDCLFIGTIFDNVEFHRCKFNNCNFHKSKFVECYIDPITIRFDKKYRKKYANIGVHIYQQLYENASRTGQYDFERKADFEFRRWKRWQLEYDRKSGKINNFEWVSRYISSIIYQYIAGFGYKPQRFVFFTLILFTALSLINKWMLSGYIKIDGRLVQDMTVSDSIFYTYSMMTALGFSTIVPDTGFAKFLAVFEAFVGIGWLGIFTALLVKRFIK